MSVNIAELTTDIINAVTNIVGSDWSKISTFAKKQIKMLAKQAEMIATSRITGSLRDDDENFVFFMGQLEKHTRNFARAVAAMTIVTLERAWNAVANLIWGAVNTALQGANLGQIALPPLPEM
ncbi:hypothetical protein [Poseidonocella sp. HB161398]|uniref:hypothetical protein n=1 Tax=Poseidonocella sp. HB161398 TaxID=2320855 RepID=UPI0011086D60|nr:hypothetical protein [Poseidonocella sp. HB161398]